MALLHYLRPTTLFDPVVLFGASVAIVALRKKLGNHGDESHACRPSQLCRSISYHSGMTCNLNPSIPRASIDRVDEIESERKAAFSEILRHVPLP